MTMTQTAIQSYAETAWIHLPRAVGLPNWDTIRTEGLWMEIYAGGEPAGLNQYVNLTTEVMVDFNTNPVATYSTTHAGNTWSGRFKSEAKLIQSVIGDEGTFEWIKLRFANNELDEQLMIHKVVFGFAARPSIEGA